MEINKPKVFRIETPEKWITDLLSSAKFRDSGDIIQICTLDAGADIILVTHDRTTKNNKCNLYGFLHPFINRFSLDFDDACKIVNKTIKKIL